MDTKLDAMLNKSFRVLGLLYPLLRDRNVSKRVKASI